ncbi:MAG: YbaK/EbsC family protein [bacterium]|nr:YbaK/EbsC family protein [bacterium]
MKKIPVKLISFLEKNKIKYQLVEHRTVYTAYDKAATLRVKPNVIGKTLVLKTDKELAVVLIPGNKNLDKNKFKKAVKAKKIDFISETVMKNKFKGFKMGAVPPFGEIFKIATFVDRLLLKEKNILLNAGIYEASLKMSPKVFEKIGAVLANFSKAKSMR